MVAKIFNLARPITLAAASAFAQNTPSSRCSKNHLRSGRDLPFSLEFRRCRAVASMLRAFILNIYARFASDRDRYTQVLQNHHPYG